MANELVGVGQAERVLAGERTVGTGDARHYHDGSRDESRSEAEESSELNVPARRYRRDDEASVGTPVVFNGTPFFGLLDTNDIVVVGDHGKAEVLGATITLLVRVLDVPNVAIDDPIQVDGVDYLVRDRLREGDAALVKLLLREDV